AGRDALHVNRLPLVERHTALGQPAHHLRVDTMLYAQQAVGQRVGVIALANGHDALRHDGPVVELGRDEVYGTTVALHAQWERLLMRVQAGERRQQRGMDIDEAAFETGHESGREHAHEPGEQNIVRLERLNLGSQRLVKGLAAREVAMWNRARLDALLPCPGQPRRVGTVRDHRTHLRIELLTLDGFYNGLHVGAPPRDQNHEAAAALSEVGHDNARLVRRKVVNSRL